MIELSDNDLMTVLGGSGGGYDCDDYRRRYDCDPPRRRYDCDPPRRREDCDDYRHGGGILTFTYGYTY